MTSINPFALNRQNLKLLITGPWTIAMERQWVRACRHNSYTGPPALIAFVATGGADSLTFIGQAVPALGGNVALDLVTVQSVPEPAAWTLAIVGIVGLGATRIIRHRIT